MSSYNSSIAGMNLSQSQSQSQGKQETVQGYYEINYEITRHPVPGIVILMCTVVVCSLYSGAQQTNRTVCFVFAVAASSYFSVT
jgi:hypothetical protein